MKSPKSSLVPAERVMRSILVIRGQRVMLDSDLATVYGVETKALNRAVKRNAERFPAEFMFRLTSAEDAILRSQIGTSKGSGGRRYLPYVFTEHGAVMLASVLNSPTAVAASIAVVRAFIHLRQLLATHADLARKLAQLEKKYDGQFQMVFDAIRQLMNPPAGPEKPRMGYHAEEK